MIQQIAVATNTRITADFAQSVLVVFLVSSTVSGCEQISYYP